MIDWSIAHRRRIALLLVVALCCGTGILSAPVPAQTASQKPKPPAGRDPGGIAIAIIGAGLDYRSPEIAKRLARDGEGEIIAWDFVDNDPRPLDIASGSGRPSLPHAGTSIAELLMREAPASRLLPVRIGEATVPAIGRALAFVSRTPARIAVTLAYPQEEPWQLFEEAARRAPQLLSIVPAKGEGLPASWTSARRAETSIIVMPVREDGGDLGPPTPIASLADVSVPVPSGLEPIAAENTAAVRLGAPAARLLALEQQPNAATLKARLLALAKPRPSGPPWIANVAELSK